MKFHAICENHLYSKAYSKGKRAVTPNLAVYVLPDYKAESLRRAHPQKIRYNRIGLTVSKKLGGAVVRNRVKRILREGLRRVMEERRVKTVYGFRDPRRRSVVRRGFLCPDPAADLCGHGCSDGDRVWTCNVRFIVLSFLSYSFRETSPQKLSTIYQQSAKPVMPMVCEVASRETRINTGENGC